MKSRRLTTQHFMILAAFAVSPFAVFHLPMKKCKGSTTSLRPFHLSACPLDGLLDQINQINEINQTDETDEKVVLEPTSPITYIQWSHA